MRKHARWMDAFLGVALSLAATAATSGAAWAEAGEVRFARQLGLGYLQLYVMQDRGLVEKHARAAGLGDVKATYTPFGNPSAISDAVLSDSVDYGAAGVTAFIIAWDKALGTSSEVRGTAALNSQPAYLNTVNPAIHALKDFTDADKIAVPAVKSSYQAIILQIAAEQAFGPGQQNRLDPLTVSLAHPDATAALLSGRTEITAHFTSPPFQNQQLADPKVHRVLSSYDVLGGPGTFSALWTTVRFHDANPKLAGAVQAAVEEAVVFIHDHPREAAEIYARLDNSKLGIDLLEELVSAPEVSYGTAPQNVVKLTGFMHRVGTLRHQPARWQELFFAELHNQPGS